MTDRNPDPTSRPWLDLPAGDLTALHGTRARAIAAQVNELAAMEGALEAMERHPEAATAREACALDSPMFRALAAV